MKNKFFKIYFEVILFTLSFGRDIKKELINGIVVEKSVTLFIN